MSNEALFLDRLLGSEGSAALGQQIGEAALADAAFRELTVALPVLRGAVTEAVRSALHVDVLAVLAEGWRTAETLDSYKSPEKVPPGTTAILKLGEHSVERDIRPKLSVHLGRDMDFPLDIALTLTGRFEGIELTIGGGAILTVGAGKCDLEAQLKLGGKDCGEPTTLKEWQLPGEYRFDPPLALP